MMANIVDLQSIVKHIVNGSFGDNICLICLLPLGEQYEDIFTKVCKKEMEYCVADILSQVCQIKVSHTDQYRVCCDCFISASTAYKFYLMTKRSEEILNFYVDELDNQVNSIDIPKEFIDDTLCFTLPAFKPDMKNYNFDITGIFSSNMHVKSVVKQENETFKYEVKIEKELLENIKNDEEVIIVMQENGEKIFYKQGDDGALVRINVDGKALEEALGVGIKSNARRRRKRNPMAYKVCSICPVKYRFFAKLKEHMKNDHDIEIFECKVCKAIIEDEDEFNSHLKTHTNIHTCGICNMVFKRRETIITHFKWHEEMQKLGELEGTHVCEMCGTMVRDEEALKEHYEKRHVKRYTCYYCGRMYKGEVSFEMHVKKHEALDHKKPLISEKEPRKKRKHACDTCGKNFVDERSLMWHQRLHTNERPYPCDVCGRRFVSLNRRNQHSVCAHTAPARRCPLCPALFHLRSMVNTHLKKVHLKAHKRRNRSSKHQNVFWRTEPVPIQELSVDIQEQILELQDAQREQDPAQW